MNQTPPFSKSVNKQTLAEQVATAVKESILNGEIAPGAALPTEPQMADAFGVSRAVIRDATRMLAAQGLVDAQHGRGVFVTESQTAAFGEALLTALRRAGATAWDVEQFESTLYPEIIALATAVAGDEELEAIGQKITAYLAQQRRLLAQFPDEAPAAEIEPLMAAYRDLMQSIFAATHNQLFTLLAPSLLRLRTSRHWESGDQEVEEILAIENAYWEQVMAALRGRDPEQARRQIRALMALPPAAEAAMRQTPVGEVPHIPLPLTPRRS